MKTNATDVSLSLILAADDMGVIGYRGKIPWLGKVPADMGRFVDITNKAGFIIMGRKTWEAFTNSLPGRVNIVVTRNRDYRDPGCIVVHSPQEAVHTVRMQGGTSAVVIGGRELAEAMLGMPEMKTVHLTRIHTVSCPRARREHLTFMPKFNNWEPVRTRRFPASRRNKHPYTFITLKRIV